MSDQHDKFADLRVARYLPHTADVDFFANRRKRMREEILRRLDEARLEPGIDLQLLATGRAAIESAFPLLDNPVRSSGDPFED